MDPSSLITSRRLYLIALFAVLAAGCWLRLPPALFGWGEPLHGVVLFHPQPRYNAMGYDEGLYRDYAGALTQVGLSAYPDIVEAYREQQAQMSDAILPPLRVLYICAGYAWHSVFGTDILQSLRDISALFSMLTLLLATLFASRLGRPNFALGVAALMAFAPTQLHMSQHGFIDGFFAFWGLLCLWLLWEALRAPRDWRWLVAYALGLSLLVLTKENSFFVWLALVALIVANRWLKFGTVTRELLLATIAGPLLGVVILVFLAGGLTNLIETYRLLVSKASQMQFAIITGDGPWSRYLVDLFLVSPVIMMLALGSIFQLHRARKPELFLLIFIATSYAVMCNVKYGMNLRYANIWDMPLRYLAFGALFTLVTPLPRYRNFVLGPAVALICGIEFRQYCILSVQYPLYELVTHELVRALHILKSP